MCDDFTAIEDEQALAARGLSRREFAAIGAAGLIASAVSAQSAAKELSLVVDHAMIKTPDGVCDAMLFRPERGKYPAVIMWPDVAGMRPAYEGMALLLASSGYAVLLVNHYYRVAKAPLLATMLEWRTPEGQEKLKPAIASLSAQGTARDTEAFVNWLDRHKAVSTKRKIGTQGYCQTGAFAIRAAAARPDRIGVAASFHGGGLVTQAPDSPHKLFGKSKASFLIAIARNDDARSPADKDALRAAAAAARRRAVIDVYNADHGWCTSDAPSFDNGEANRARAHLLELYKKL
ncbi:MAG: dienelactone hydrolase family protein [Novosphingobium sp.]|uniref:dienelactone hydrolase family protein n=1 Tax=Novosphingobium sp. TaxID=1874826 RepID=UPI0032BAABB6